MVKLRRKRNKTPRKGQFKDGHDPRRHVAVGNQYAAGPHNNPRNGIVTQQLIAALNEEYLEKTEGRNGRPGRKKTGITKLAKMCLNLVELACEDRDIEAIKFIIERVDGKSVQPIAGRVEHDHMHVLQAVAEKLSDEEVKTMAGVSRKMLEAQGITIENEP